MDVEIMEQFFADNLPNMDIVDPLCRIFKENSNAELPLILSFSHAFYLSLIQNNYLKEPGSKSSVLPIINFFSFWSTKYSRETLDRD